MWYKCSLRLRPPGSWINMETIWHKLGPGNKGPPSKRWHHGGDGAQVHREERSSQTPPFLPPQCPSSAFYWPQIAKSQLGCFRDVVYRKKLKIWDANDQHTWSRSTTQTNFKGLPLMSETRKEYTHRHLYSYNYFLSHSSRREWMNIIHIFI